MTVPVDFVRAATTIIGERTRSGNMQGQSNPQNFTQMQMLECRIKEVDLKRKVIKVTHWVDGSDLFAGSWVPLAHTIHDIVDRFGKIRTGMSVLVFFVGWPVPASAYAFIIGEEGEAGPSKDQVPNTITRAFHGILMEQS